MKQHCFFLLTAEQKDSFVFRAPAGQLFDTMEPGIWILKKAGESNAADYEIIYLNKSAAAVAGPDARGKMLSNTATGREGLAEKIQAAECCGVFLYRSIVNGMISWEPQPAAAKASKDIDDADLVQSIAAATPDILFVMNLYSKELLFINRSVEQQLGYTGEQAEHMTHPFFDIIHPEDLPAVLDHLEQMKDAKLNEVREISYRVLDANNTIRWIKDRNTVFKTDKNGRAIEKTGILQDITEYKFAEEAIIKQSTLLKQAEQLAKAGSWEYDTGSKEFNWSDGMYSLFDIKKHSEVSPSIYLTHAIPEDLAVAEKVRHAIEESYENLDVTLHIKPDGVVKTLRIKTEYLATGKSPAKMLGVDVDISEAVQAEEKIHVLNRALNEKNQALESAHSEIQTFNGIAATDYKSTLQNLYTNLEFILAKDARNLSDAGKANLRKMQVAIQKMKLLTEDIVSYSRIQTLDNVLIPVSLERILRLAVKDLTNKIEEYALDLTHDNLPEISGYPLLLVLLFYHLMDNAVKFRSPERTPSLHISYERSPAPELLADVHPGSYHRISFIDNGKGFTATESEKIFSMFYRVKSEIKYKGSGVGLAVVKKVMDIHNGFVIATASEDGAVFSCYFPAS